MDEESNICDQCGKPQSVDDQIEQCQCSGVEVVDEIQSMCASCHKPVVELNKEKKWEQVFGSNFCACDKPSLIDNEVVNYLINLKYKESIDTKYSGDRQVLNKQFELDAERYEFLAELGRGATGKVYLCHDRRLDKKIAVKVLLRLEDEKMVAFHKEAQATSDLNHSYIVDIIDFGITESGVPFMAMDYISGISLKQVLRKLGVLRQSIAIDIVKKVCIALAYAHGEGVFHRDIKPDNIILVLDSSEDLSIKVIDFGIAHVMGNTGSRKEFQGRTLVGTPIYMSPDSATGKKYSAASEVYSLGCVLFEMLTGRPPFVKSEVLQVMHAHVKEEAPGINDVGEFFYSEVLESLVSKCLEKEPADRVSNMTEFFDVLEDFDSADLDDEDGNLFDNVEDEEDAEEQERAENAFQSTDQKVLVLRAVMIVLVLSIFSGFIYYMISGTAGDEIHSTAPKEKKLKRKKRKPVKRATTCRSNFCKLGREKLKKHDLRRAIRLFKQGLSVEPNCADAYVGIGEAQLRLGKRDEAIKTLNKAIVLDPQNLNAYMCRARTYRKEEDYQNVLDDTTTIINLKPNAEAYLLRAKAKFYLSSFEVNEFENEGFNDIEKAIKLNPNLASAYNAKAVFLASRKRVKEAIAALNKAIELNPKDSDYYKHRSSAYFHLKQYDKSLKDIDKVIEMNPRSGEPLALKAGLYAQTGRLEEAFDFYSKALRADPDKFRYHYQRAEISLKLKNYQNAVEDYSKIIAANPLDDEALRRRGDAYVLTGNYDKALEDYDDAIKLYPGSAGSYKARSRIHRQLGNIIAAEKDEAKAKELDKKPAVKKI